jgi:hypothetical protein
MNATGEWLVTAGGNQFVVVPVGSAKELRRFVDTAEVFVLRNDTEIAFAEARTGTMVHAIAASNTPGAFAAWDSGSFERELARHRTSTRVVNIIAVGVGLGSGAVLACVAAWSALPAALAALITAASAGAVTFASVRAGRIGAWREGEQLVISNFWRTNRVPLERISHFDCSRSGNAIVATAVEHSGRVRRITGLALARGTGGIERVIALNAAFRSRAGDTGRGEDMPVPPAGEP